MRIGFVINPCAGLGGSVALKGSDGARIVEQALARGATPRAQERAGSAMKIALDGLVAGEFTLLTAAGAMGERVLSGIGVSAEIVYEPDLLPSESTVARTSAEDTKQAVRYFVEARADIIIFAGGDGTARDVLDVLGDELQSALPVIGIPAGVKIHSSVYATSPVRAGELIRLVMQGEPVSLHEAQVMDLDEQAFRDGQVISRCYGYLNVPVDDTRMQLNKQGGMNSEDLVLQDIAADVVESMQPDVVYLIGSGSTTAAIMDFMAIENTLLGIDVICNEQLVASDVDEKTILDIIRGHESKMVVTVIGGQGHIFGRGNQQLSAEVIRQVIRQDENNVSDKLDNIIIVASDEKLRSLDKRPMLSDTGDVLLDKQLSGLYTVTTGYQQKTLYKLA